MLHTLRHRFARVSLFWRYFFLLAAVLLLMIVSLTAISGRFSEILRASRLEQMQISFEKNCELFSRDVFKAYSLSTVMEESDDFLSVNSDNAGKTQNLFRFTRVRDYFGKLCTVQDLPAESFLYLRKSGVCMTRHRVFSDADALFGSYFSYEDPAQAPDLTPVQALPSLQLLPLSNISINGRVARPYLTLLIRSTLSDTVYGFLYPLDDVLSSFQLDILPEDTALTFTFFDGTPLLSYGLQGNKDSYIWLDAQVNAVSCRVSLGIPQTYFSSAARSARSTAGLGLLLTAVLGALLCSLFALFCVKPFHRLMKACPGNQAPQESELAFLERTLSEAKQQSLSLQALFLSNLLTRSTAGLPISKSEHEKVLAAFPMLGQSMRAAVVYDRDSDDEIDGFTSIDSLLRASLPEQFLCQYINTQESILLLPDAAGALDSLNTLLRQLNDGATHDLRFVCGVSEPFIGLDEAGAAIRQAQSCIPDGEELMLAHSLPDFEEKPKSFDAQQFQQMLMERDRASALSQLEYYASHAGKKGAPSPEELFYRILALLRDFALAECLSFQEYEKAAYHHSRSPASNLRRLKAILNGLFDQRAIVQRTDRQRRCDQIVQYIRDNYSDATLCLASLSRQFGVSERFVYNSVLEATGMNVSSFLAQIRMTEAARLLRQTQESVSSVAEQCGYPVESTFYRNFKKYYRITPAEYKATLRTSSD